MRSDTERTNSVLTESQRKHLREGGGANATIRMARKRIRERLQASIFDYSLILNALPLEDIDEALSDEDPPMSVELPVASALPDVIALLYLVDRDAELKGPYEGWRMENKVEAGIHRALTRRLGVEVKSIDVDITIKRGADLHDLADGPLDELPEATLRQLFFARVISAEQYDAAVQSRTPKNVALDQDGPNGEHDEAEQTEE